MKVDIISSGSSGNCILIDDSIVIDAGITKKMFFKYLETQEIDPQGIDLLIVTHKHNDHYKSPLVKWFLQEEIQTVLPEDVPDSDDLTIFLPQKREIIEIEHGDYIIKAYPQKHHDIVNFALVIEKDSKRLLYSTDLDTLSASDIGVGINHLGQFDIIMLEGNYDEHYLNEYLNTNIELEHNVKASHMTPDELDKYVRMHYAYFSKDIAQNMFRAINNRRHLSKQQARLYVKEHLKPNGVYYEIHRSSKFYNKPTDWELN